MMRLLFLIMTFRLFLQPDPDPDPVWAAQIFFYAWHKNKNVSINQS